MKIALGQINNTVGDFDGNLELIKNNTIEAAANSASIIVFPELALCGYPVRDLVELDEFRRLNDEAVQKLVDFSKNMEILIVVGALGPKADDPWHGATNSAYAILGGKVHYRYAKRLLPTYDVFDEWRNFSAGGTSYGFDFGGRRIGLTICEDIWANKEFKKRYGIRDKYNADPVDDLFEDGCNLIINLSASPFTRHKLDVRRDLLHTIATRYKVDIVYCNMVGGNDSLVFDGNSMAFNKDGSPIANAASFETEIAYADFEKCEGTFKFQLTDELPQVWSALVLGLQDYVRKCGFTDVVIGLSGGIDSALVSALAVEALGASHVTCITMPSEFSSEGSIKDSVAFADGHGVRLLMIPIEGIKTSLLDAFSKKKEAPVHDPSFHSQPYWADMGMRLSPLADENVQARIRGTILMSYSNTTRALVLSTGNKSETAVGYCTLYGDMCGGLSVIADVPKTTVYTLARWYNDRAKLHASVCSSKVLAATIEARQIPENTITKAPSAELAPGQYDQQSLPPYRFLTPSFKPMWKSG